MDTRPSAWARRTAGVALAFASAVALFAALAPARAQEPAASNEGERLGQRLFLTSCGLCHADPDLVNKAPGPILSKTTLNGRTEDIAAFIKTGTNTMPSFSVNFTDAEIDAIARYIITVPAREAAK